MAVQFSDQTNEILNRFEEKLNIKEVDPGSLPKVSNEENKENFENKQQSAAINDEQIKQDKINLLIDICAAGEDPQNIVHLIDELELGPEIINAFNKNGVSPLLAYLTSKNPKVDITKFINLLKAKGLDPNFKDLNNNHNTALHLAILHKFDNKELNKIFKERLKEFLKHEDVLLNVKNLSGQTPLDLAITSQDPDIVKNAQILVENGGQLGRLVKNDEVDAKKDDKPGKMRGDLEDKIKQYQDEVVNKAKEDLANKEKLLQQQKRQQLQEKQDQVRQQAIANAQAALEVHMELKEFFAREIAKQKEQDQNGNFFTGKINAVDERNNQNIIEISGQKIDLSDKATLNLLLHYYTARGNVNAVGFLMMQPGIDFNTSVGGVSILDAAINSGSSDLVLTLCIKNPEIVSNAKGTQKSDLANLLNNIDKKEFPAVDKIIAQLQEDKSAGDKTPNNRLNEELGRLKMSQDDMAISYANRPQNDNLGQEKYSVKNDVVEQNSKSNLKDQEQTQNLSNSKHDVKPEIDSSISQARDKNEVTEKKDSENNEKIDLKDNEMRQSLQDVKEAFSQNKSMKSDISRLNNDVLIPRDKSKNGPEPRSSCRPKGAKLLSNSKNIDALDLANFTDERSR